MKPYRIGNRSVINSIQHEHARSDRGDARSRVPRLSITLRCSIALISIHGCRPPHVMFDMRQGARDAREQEVAGVLPLMPVTTVGAPGEYGLNPRVANGARHEVK